MTGRVCRRHGTPYPLREWRGKLVEDNCPKCMEDVRAALTLARDKQHTSSGGKKCPYCIEGKLYWEHNTLTCGDCGGTGKATPRVTGDDVVERVARAICETHGFDPEKCLSGYSWEAGEMGRVEGGSVCHHRAWQDWVEEARAAIAALSASPLVDSEKGR
jgi:hypothetical protein